MKCIKITITGRVQGVWFRKHTKERADELGILGTIQNIMDRSVLIIAQGEENNLNEFLKYCHKGSPLSNVTNVSSEDLIPQDLSSFEILK